MSTHNTLFCEKMSIVLYEKITISRATVIDLITAHASSLYIYTVSILLSSTL